MYLNSMKIKNSEIYVHIPFCVKKCDYCDFVSFACDDTVKHAYFDSLIKEIELNAESGADMPVDSVFFGGGTPGIADAYEILRVLDTLRSRYKVSSEAEISIELNPASADIEKIRTYRSAGINRVSIGLQSADDRELKILGRPHDFNDFLRTYDDVYKAGFDNVNIDIMSALPGQTLETYLNTLNTVARLKPSHISAYSLIIEEGTPFFERYKDNKGLPDEDTERKMYYATKEVLGKAGYMRYEISNYAVSGKECRHNTGYWERKPYMGFGLAAASFDGSKRYQMHNDLKRYIQGDHEREITLLSKEDAMAEFMFLGLRMMKGIKKTLFKEEFSADIYDIYGSVIEKQKEMNLIKEEGDRIFLTDYGIDVSNVVFADYLLV